MTTSQINTELKNTKELMNKLMDCIQEGKKEYYSDYLKASAYFLKLSKFKPSHDLSIA